MTVSFKKMIDTKRREDDSWNFGQIHLSVKEIRPVQKQQNHLNNMMIYNPIGEDSNEKPARKNPFSQKKARNFASGFC